jgi:hypothetical protein
MYGTQYTVNTEDLVYLFTAENIWLKKRRMFDVPYFYLCFYFYFRVTFYSYIIFYLSSDQT